MGSYAELRVDSLVLLQGKNVIPSAWFLAFTRTDLDGTRLSKEVAAAVATAQPRVAALERLASPSLKKALRSFLSTLRKRHGRLVLDPAGIMGMLGEEALREHLLSSIARFEGALTVARAVEIEGLDADDADEKRVTAEPLQEFFGYDADEPLAWLRARRPRLPADFEAAVGSFFSALGVTRPNPDYQSIYGDERGTWTWTVRLSPPNDWWMELSRIEPSGWNSVGAMDTPDRVVGPGIDFGSRLSPARIELLGTMVGRNRSLLTMPERYIREWPACPGGDAFWRAFPRTEPEVEVLRESLRGRLRDAIAANKSARTPGAARRVDLGPLGALEIRFVAESGGVPDHLALSMVDGPGDRSWRTPTPQFLLTPSDQEEVADSFLSDLAKEAGSPAGARFLGGVGQLVLRSNRTIEQAVTFSLWLHNQNDLRPWSRWLMTLPDEAARLARIAQG